MYNTGHRTITATWYYVHFCHMSSLVCLWGNLLSWLMFRNGQQRDTCGLSGWPNQLFGHLYFKRLPSHYGCSRLWNFIHLEIMYPLWTNMMICKPKLFLATLKIQVCLSSFLSFAITENCFTTSHVLCCPLHCCKQGAIISSLVLLLVDEYSKQPTTSSFVPPSQWSKSE